MELMLRVMNPQVLAVDELSASSEIQAVGSASNSGVAVFATAHGADLRELRRRPGYAELLREGNFRWVIVLHGFGEYEMERLENLC